MCDGDGDGDGESPTKTQSASPRREAEGEGRGVCGWWLGDVPVVEEELDDDVVQLVEEEAELAAVGDAGGEATGGEGSLDPG